MPLYEYACSRCENRFELLVFATASGRAKKVACPSCGGARVKKLPSVFGVGAAAPSRSASERPCPSGMCESPDRGECPPST